MQKEGKHVLSLYTEKGVKCEAVFDNIDAAMENIKYVLPWKTKHSGTTIFDLLQNAMKSEEDQSRFSNLYETGKYLEKVLSDFNRNASDDYPYAFPVIYDKEDGSIEFGDDFYWIQFSTLKEKARSISHVWFLDWFDKRVYDEIINLTGINLPPYFDYDSYEDFLYLHDYILENNK